MNYSNDYSSDSVSLDTEDSEEETEEEDTEKEVVEETVPSTATPGVPEGPAYGPQRKLSRGEDTYQFSEELAYAKERKFICSLVTLQSAAALLLSGNNFSETSRTAEFVLPISQLFIVCSVFICFLQ